MTNDTQNLADYGNMAMMRQEANAKQGSETNWNLAWRGASMSDPFRVHPQEHPRMPTVAEARARYLQTRKLRD